ncbi:hypothetical protein [Paraburkholderia sp. SIMBA_054]|uniref:hypothetical protein n=1 Tax=Paraburkholderia sp. SIMBA_054 TaxID=3085795 RepID=UPI0039784BE9
MPLNKMHASTTTWPWVFAAWHAANWAQACGFVGFSPARLAPGPTVLFVLAAAGGVVMNLGYYWNRRAPPKPLVVIHALVAVVGFVLLVTATWSVRG